VKSALQGREVVEFGGIEPNPLYETCLEAVALVKNRQVKFLLAVGGGSVTCRRFRRRHALIAR
jgi:NADP-dependent alcohol dehydrogenase